MPYIIKFAHVIKQRLKPGLIFTLYSLKYEACTGQHLIVSVVLSVYAVHDIHIPTSLSYIVRYEKAESLKILP